MLVVRCGALSFTHPSTSLGWGAIAEDRAVPHNQWDVRVWVLLLWIPAVPGRGHVALTPPNSSSGHCCSHGREGRTWLLRDHGRRGP